MLDIKRRIKRIIIRILKKMIRILEKSSAGEREEDVNFKILLLTNRDSDNVGDQVIEVCDLSLIHAVMKNLDMENIHYSINSRAVGIITRKYLQTRETELLALPDKLIREANVVVFGGAPVFAFDHQDFYEKTSVLVDIAEKNKKPVIFSAIGVEGYEENNERCQRLKAALRQECVKQITTRDDFESLQKFADDGAVTIAKVSDPAVLVSNIIKSKEKVNSPDDIKKIGIFVLRGGGFIDNGIKISRENAVDMWKEIAGELERRGYTYEFLTSGHYADEAALDYMIRNHEIPLERCAFNMNTPEQLMKKINTYDGVISCRLHPSIIAYSCDIPSIGIVWNDKVQFFYDSIGYSDRAVDPLQTRPQEIVEKLENAMEAGIQKNEDELVSVYNYLFYGFKNLLCPEASEKVPYSYSELIANLPEFKNTPVKEKEEKLKRKFRRIYEHYNSLLKNIEDLKKDMGNR